MLQNERDNKSKEVRLLVTCLETVRKEIHTLLESITSINTTQTKPLEVQCRHIDSIIAQCLGIEISEVLIHIFCQSYTHTQQGYLL